MTCDRSVVSPGTPVVSINKTAHHNITEILFKVALSILSQLNIILFSINYEAQSNATEQRGIFRPMLGLEYNMIIYWTETAIYSAIWKKKKKKKNLRIENHVSSRIEMEYTFLFLARILQLTKIKVYFLDDYSPIFAITTAVSTLFSSDEHFSLPQ